MISFQSFPDAETWPTGVPIATVGFAAPLWIVPHRVTKAALAVLTCRSTLSQVFRLLAVWHRVYLPFARY